MKKLSEDTLPKDKEYLIAQDFILHGTYYYRVTAKTMGAAVAQIEEDNDLHPEDYEAQNADGINRLHRSGGGQL